MATPRKRRPSRERQPLNFPDTREDQFFEQLRPLLNNYGWNWIHHYDSRRSNWGYPDITAVSKNRPEMFYAELKGWSGYLSDDQRLWLDDLVRAGQRCYVWWPWHLGEALHVISGWKILDGISIETIPRWPYGE